MINFYNILNLENFKNNIIYNNFILIFSISLILKLSIAFIFNSPLPEISYIPYLEKVTNENIIFVDNEFILKNSKINFPYGIMMVLSFYPLFFLSNLLNYPGEFSYFGTLLIADFFIFICLIKIINKSLDKLLILYWCNPVLIILTYYFGFNDILPTLFLIYSIYFLKIYKFFFSSLAIALSVSCKFSMILIIPIIIIYLHHNKLIKHKFNSYSFLTFFLLILFNSPQFLNEASKEMFANNPNALESIFVQAAEFGNQTLLIMPILYSIIMLFIWGLNRINHSLFINISCILFLSVSFLINSSPGWYAWAIPLLILFRGSFSTKDYYLILIFTTFLIFEILVLGPLGIYKKEFYSTNIFIISFFKNYVDIFHSIYFATGLIFLLRLWKLGIIDNDYYKLWRKPFVVGISGNSGVGKTSLTKNLELVFGINSVTKIKGDGYHIWDRSKLIWNTITHLNPRANELQKFNEDVDDLISGKNIQISNYNHSTGKKNFINNVKTKNFLILEGLHTFIFKKLREKCDLKIFLEVDEKLRREFKIARDTEERGYKKEDILLNIKKRKSDEKKYIETQKAFSDVNIKLNGTKNYTKIKHNKRFIVEVISKDPTYFLKLSKMLTKYSNVGFKIDYGIENKLFLNGQIDSKNIIKIAKEMIKDYDDFFLEKAKWAIGAKGIVQLITIIEIYQQIKKRIT